MLKEKLTDNEALFLEALVDAIRHGDSGAKIQHTRSLNTVTISIIPSKEEFKQDIINSLIYVHRLYHLKVTFSKSLSKSKNITFSIDLENYS